MLLGHQVFLIFSLLVYVKLQNKYKMDTLVMVIMAIPSNVMAKPLNKPKTAIKDALGNVDISFDFLGVSKNKHRDKNVQVTGDYSYVDPKSTLRKIDCSSGTSGVKACSAAVPLPAEDTSERAQNKHEYIKLLCHVEDSNPRTSKTLFDVSPTGLVAVSPVAPVEESLASSAVENLKVLYVPARKSLEDKDILLAMLTPATRLIFNKTILPRLNSPSAPDKHGMEVLSPSEVSILAPASSLAKAEILPALETTVQTEAPVITPVKVWSKSLVNARSTSTIPAKTAVSTKTWPTSLARIFPAVSVRVPHKASANYLPAATAIRTTPAIPTPGLIALSPFELLELHVLVDNSTDSYHNDLTAQLTLSTKRMCNSILLANSADDLNEISLMKL